jgi:transposase
LPRLFADETTAPVLDPGRGRTKTGQLWAYAADDRPWGGSDPRGVAYVYAPDRKSERPIAHMEGYRKLADRGDVRLAFCRSHVRRRFYEPATPGPSPIASEALEHIAALYAVEKDIRGRGADERRAVRQRKGRPLVDALEPWLRAKLGLISQKSKLAEAIRYALSRWGPFCGQRKTRRGRGHRRFRERVGKSSAQHAGPAQAQKSRSKRPCQDPAFQHAHHSLHDGRLSR